MGNAMRNALLALSQNEYYHIKDIINKVILSYLRIFQMLDYSPSHLRYETVWYKKVVVRGLEGLTN